MGDLTNLGICAWIAETWKHPTDPTSFSNLQIAFKVAFPREKSLEEWALPEFMVRAEQHATLIGNGWEFNQWPRSLQRVQWANAREAPYPDRFRFPAAGHLGSQFIIHPLPVLTENETHLGPEFEVCRSLPIVQIAVTQEAPENTETLNYNSDNIPVVSGEVARSEQETNKEIAEAKEVTKCNWNAGADTASEASDR